MHTKSYYFNMALTSFVVMLLFIVVFYIGIIVRHWLVFDVGMFGAIIACIAAVYNVTQYENVKSVERQFGYTIEELIAMEKAEEEAAKKALEEDETDE